MLESITAFLAGDGGLLSLTASAFLSATILPGSSEALLAAMVASAPETSRTVMLVALASAANTLGSMTSWAIGRYFPKRAPAAAALSQVRRWGAPALFFAWVPIVGDFLPLAAGWLEVRLLQVFFWTALGKTARYGAIAAAVLELI